MELLHCSHSTSIQRSDNTLVPGGTKPVSTTSGECHHLQGQFVNSLNLPAHSQFPTAGNQYVRSPTEKLRESLGSLSPSKHAPRTVCSRHHGFVSRRFFPTPFETYKTFKQSDDLGWLAELASLKSNRRKKQTAAPSQIPSPQASEKFQRFLTDISGGFSKRQSREVKHADDASREILSFGVSSERRGLRNGLGL